MNVMATCTRRQLIATGLALAAVVSVRTGAAGQKFQVQDPIRWTIDSQDASGVLAREVDVVYDMLENALYWPGDQTPDVRAQNVNTIDEVPDSTWFTNRVGAGPATIDELLQGPGTGTGPAPGRWTVIRAENGRGMPVLTVRDAVGQVWSITFDPPGYPAMATGTEVVVTKLVWALGYHVPEMHIATLRPDQLTIDPSARITTTGFGRRALDGEEISALLSKAHREPDGSYRVGARKALAGRPVGGFRFYGTRSDDPNDVVLHEHRRELRALGTFSAWLNHVDASAVNTLDTVVEQDGRQVVRHHLVGFASSLGSAEVFRCEAFDGRADVVEGDETLATLPTLAFSTRERRTISLYRAPSVGAFSRDNSPWDPEEWKPRYGNSAFRSARMDDKFWAARRLQAFSDDLLRAVVRVGRFDDPSSEAMLSTFLIQRRDAILRRYLPAVNPVVDVRLSLSGTLTFANAAVDAGVASPPAAYVVAWRRFDNQTGATSDLGVSRASEPGVTTPANLASEAVGTFIRAEISATGGPGGWTEPAHAYFRRDAAGWSLVGFERVPAGNRPGLADRTWRRQLTS